MRTTLFVLLALVGLAACVVKAGADGRDERKALRPAVEWSGLFSAVEESRCVRIASPAEWVTLWQEHLGSGAPGPRRPEAVLPEVDFDEYLVVGIFMGKQLGKGRVSLISIADEGELIRLRFGQDFQPSRDQLEAKPFGIFVIPRSPKPIVVEEDISNFGRQPQWEERWRLQGSQCR